MLPEREQRTIFLQNFMKEAKVSRPTFYKDLNALKDELHDIPAARLRVWANMLSVKMEDLFISY
jgi:hypothetical protein